MHLVTMLGNATRGAPKPAAALSSRVDGTDDWMGLGEKISVKAALDWYMGVHVVLGGEQGRSMEDQRTLKLSRGGPGTRVSR